MCSDFAVLNNQCSGIGRLVLEVSWQHLCQAVVASKTMNAGFNENKTELGVLVLAVLLQMLADSHGLLDKAVQILRQLWCETLGAKDADDLVTSDHLHLRDAVGIPKSDANLRWSVTLLCHVANFLDGVSSGLLHP